VRTFSTLHPPAPPAGSLRLVVVHDRWLHGLLFGALALVGLVFAGRPLGGKLIVLGLALTAVLLIGVFFPTLAARILDGTLVAAAVLILLLWLLGSAYRLSRRASRPAVGASRSPFAGPEEDFRASTLASTPLDSPPADDVTGTMDIEIVDSDNEAEPPAEPDRRNQEGGGGHD
ncbi:MAG: hypothetical protein AB7O38_29375, partial [Pirellulaceae bacterium]